jgi:LysM repeat protein
MKGTTIYPGQKLIVYVPSGSSSTAPVSASPPVTQQSQEPSPPEEQKATEHIVKSGETLAVIAGKYGCSVKDLQEWNNLNSTLIHPKQKLIVKAPVTNDPVTASASPTENIQASGEQEFIIHTVKAGETLWDIAHMYEGVTVDKIRTWNRITDDKGLQVGQKLKIAVNNP